MAGHSRQDRSGRDRPEDTESFSVLYISWPKLPAYLGQRQVVVRRRRRWVAYGGGVVRVLQVDLPRGGRVEALVGGVTPPQALDQHGRRWYLTIEVLLALFLLHLQCESGT